MSDKRFLIDTAADVRRKKQEIDRAFIEITRIKKQIGLLKNRIITMNNGQLRNSYKELKKLKVTKSADKIFIHSQNVMLELDGLFSALHDAEIILQQQAQYYGKTIIN